VRVALVSYEFGEYAVRLADALAREAEVLLVLPERLLAPYASLLQREVRLCPFAKPRLRQPVQQLRTIGRIRRAIAAFAPTVLHLQHGHLWFNLCLPLFRRYPLVVTVHDPRAHVGDRASRRTPQAIMSLGYRRGRRLIVHAEALRRQVVEELGLPGDRVDVVPHIELGGSHTDGHGQEDPALVLFFGRIWEYKGLEYLIRAEPIVAERIPGLRICIAGAGEDLGRYRAMMQHPDRFIIHNHYISDEMRADLFRRSSLVVLPYLEASQSGVVPLAYAFGKPVVATRVGGLPELVADGWNGLLVPPRDEHSLAEAMIRLLADPELRRRLGENGRHTLRTELCGSAVAQRTLQVYRRACCT
jgi:glycosyltransferase involved in cell wall biosynthesis